MVVRGWNIKQTIINTSRQLECRWWSWHVVRCGAGSTDGHDPGFGVVLVVESGVMVSSCEHDFGILLGFGTTTFKPPDDGILPCVGWVAFCGGWLLVLLLVVPHTRCVVAGSGGVLLIVTV